MIYVEWFCLNLLWFYQWLAYSTRQFARFRTFSPVSINITDWKGRSWTKPANSFTFSKGFRIKLDKITVILWNLHLFIFISNKVIACGPDNPSKFEKQRYSLYDVGRLVKRIRLVKMHECNPFYSKIQHK